MKNHIIDKPGIISHQGLSRRKFIGALTIGSVLSFLSSHPVLAHAGLRGSGWQAGVGRRVITPEHAVWLAGYGSKREPNGKLHDIWVKVLYLKDKKGKQAILITSDNQGMSRTISDRIYQKIKENFGFDRSEMMLTFSHNHSGPCLTDDLVDYYPSDDQQRKLVNEYSDWMVLQMVEAVGDALRNQQPVDIEIGEGHCTFAVNRRDNKEAEVPLLLEKGIALKGAIDHYVPVLTVKSRKKEKLIGLLFGYACHPTTLSGYQWSGDYPGFAQISLEKKYPDVCAMFFNTCGGDQNPIPRRTVALCEQYGEMLSKSVQEVLSKPMKPISNGLKTAFTYVNLAYEEIATSEKLIPIANGSNEIQARWAKRMLEKIKNGEQFPTFYPYPIQAWSLGKELLLIGIGGEAVVDYSLRFKREFSETTTWVSGYTNDMAGYIPSRRVWDEGGYEGGSHLDEYGRPAWRWAGDIEDRIANTVHKIVKTVR